VLAQDDLVGPTFITSKATIGTGHPISLASNPINHKAYVFPLAESQTAELGEPTTIDTIWRCARVPESEDKVTFKSAQDRYLASDKVGEVTAEREARGPTEEFILERIEEKGKGAFAIRSAAWGKYMSLDEVAGGKLELRCDAESIGEDEVWYIKMQAEFLGKMEEEKRKRQRQLQPDDGLVIVKDLKAAEEANM
jgi:protein FRG1